MSERTALDERLDELYREHPEGFVARRDRLVKELRAAGDRDEADRVKKLRRPSVAAWLINRVALEDPAKLEESAEATRGLEEAQRRALEGDQEGAAAWRAAAARESEAIEAIVGLAESSARAARHPASERVLQLVGETLRAASGDPELRERILRGRLERERSAATLGTVDVGRLRPRERGGEKRRDLTRARRELERLQEELAAAAEREERLAALVAQTEETLRQEKRTLAETKRETAKLKRQVKAAERRTQEKGEQR